ncbi:MAG TPA: LptA/OstA family protein [Candidatus Acidoferrales bacterium]|nr:LptA/OstA family protein [Candidatus Acidoferrales bacterium]
MKRSEAQLYARIAAAIAAVITVAVLIVLLRRSYQEKQAEKSAPPPVPASVQRKSEEFSFSKMEGTRTIFTIRASQATQLKGTNRSVLRDVWITIYGRNGDRNDAMHTQQCDYENASGRVVCAGDVQLDLESADDAKRQANGSQAGERGPRIVHVATRGLQFESGSGDAETDQGVEFNFPGGEGRAQGVKYQSADGMLELQRAVQMKLQPPASAGEASKSSANTARPPVEVSAASLQYRREENLMLLRGPVDAKQAAASGPKELRASELTLQLDEKFQARKLTARGTDKQPAEIESAAAKGKTTVAASEFAAQLAPTGWIENFRAEGGVDAASANGPAKSRVRSAKIEGAMEPRVNQPKTVDLSGGVKMDSEATGQSRHMETAAMRVDFAPVTKGKQQGSEARHAESNSRTMISWDDTQNSRGSSTRGAGNAANRAQADMQLTGERMEMDFSEQNRLKTLKAHDGAELHRKESGKPEAVSTSQELAANFDVQGEWTDVEQSGKFQLHNGAQTAQAANAKLTRAPDVLTLDQNAQAGDGQSTTSARSIVLNQTKGDTRAEGNVVSTYLNASRSTGGNAPGGTVGPQLGPEPAHVTAEHLQSNSKTGVALYTGNARMWQGDTTMEAAQIQLDQKSRRIDAKENVTAVFVQMPKTNTNTSAATGSPPNSPSRGREAASRGRGGAAEGPDLWHVKAGALTYWDGESRAHAEGGVQADSAEKSMKSRTADFNFESSSVPNGGKTQRLSRATGDGDVSIRVRDEHGSAEHAEYDSTTDKLVLSGGNPTFFDGSGNKTTGRQLTVNLADDTIQVQSEEGSRTPRHRDEK